MDLLPFEESLFKRSRRPDCRQSISLEYLTWPGFSAPFGPPGEITDLIIYALNPCAEYWEDVETLRGYYLRLDQELEQQARLSA